MNNQKSMNVFKVLYICVCIVILSQPSWSLTILNGTGGGYGSGGGEALRSMGDSSIEGLVIQSAGYFLQSYSNILFYMHRVEISAPEAMDYEELKMFLDKALGNMVAAHSSYLALKQLADVTPYNPVIIEALKVFDYKSFKTANNCRTDMYNKVMEYLKAGDIRGVYGMSVADTQVMIEYIEQLKGQVDAGKFPSIKTTWQLNQAITDMFLKGQYVAMIFSELNGN